MGTLNRIFKIFEINLIKTILLNLKVFPFKQAVKMPVIVYGGYTVFDLFSLQRGQIELECPCRTGLIRLNRRIGYNIGSKLRGSIGLFGKLIIKGKCDIGQGCNIVIRKGAIMYVGDDLTIAGASRIHVYEGIKIGRQTFISWNVHISDTDYHYFIKDDRIFDRNRKIEIGDNVWIGHDVVVTKGTLIPSNSIVACNSLINKRFFENENGVLIAGIPGQIKRFNIKPINDFKIDQQIDLYFRNHINDIYDGLSTSLFNLN